MPSKNTPKNTNPSPDPPYDAQELLLAQMHEHLLFALKSLLRHQTMSSVSWRLWVLCGVFIWLLAREVALLLRLSSPYTLEQKSIDTGISEDPKTGEIWYTDG